MLRCVVFRCFVGGQGVSYRHAPMTSSAIVSRLCDAGLWPSFSLHEAPFQTPTLLLILLLKLRQFVVGEAGHIWFHPKGRRLPALVGCGRCRNIRPISLVCGS